VARRTGAAEATGTAAALNRRIDSPLRTYAMHSH